MQTQIILEALFAVFVLVAVSLLAFNSIYFSGMLRRRIMATLDRQAEKLSKVEKDALSGITKSDILRAQAALAVAGVLVAAASGSPELFLVFAVVTLLAPKYYVRMMEQRYVKEYRDNLPDMLESIVASVRAGMSVINALQLFAEKNTTAAGREIRYMLGRIEYGMSVADALAELEKRINIEENELVVTALTTATESGGNVSEVLGTILSSVRKKEEISKEMKALTSQGVMSGVIVGAMPVIMLAVIYMMDKELVMPLFTTKAGAMLLCVSVCMEAAGAFFISRIVKMKD